ncbi:hypothetical protein PIB30_039649 [Stylosanthes scabra]|uniref:Uncharacterized protein n=1 Tax=Stylosanthes scabra TaxID=79078 RepID=A0ABU6TEL9_9FABA|nr:hypothetical protein [Stylosanthes scabra]
MEKSIRKAKKNMGVMIDKRKVKKRETGHRMTARDLGSYLGGSCPHRAPARLSLATTQWMVNSVTAVDCATAHPPPCDRTVASGRIKMKAKNGIPNFRARAKPLLKAQFDLFDEGTAETQATIHLRINFSF